MGFLQRVVTGKQKKPVLAIIYGQGGVGKSTFGAKAPSPIFVGPEQGTAWLDVPRLPTNLSFAEYLTTINELATTEHVYNTLVLDSLDTLEPLIFDDVCAMDGSKSIEAAQGGYGKGYVAALNKWREMHHALSNLRETKGMNIIAIAHATTKSHTDPRTNQTWNRYVMKLNEKAAQLWREFVDVQLFCTFELFASEKNGKVKAVSSGRRVMYSNWSAAFDAKNRMGLPEEMDLSWETFFDNYQISQPEKPEVILKQIQELIERVTDSAVREKVMNAVEKAKSDASELARINNKLLTIVGA
jgi:hypothetical protein